MTSHSITTSEYTAPSATQPDGNTRPAGFLNRHLRRETSSGGFVPEIDGLRFFAIGLVLIFHMNGFLKVYSPLARDWHIEANWLNLVAGKSDVGVQVFFAISGFILSLPFARQRLLGGKRVSLRAYFLRRITRLEPPYIISTIFAAAMVIVVKHDAIRQVLRHTLVSLAYLHGLLFNTFPVNGVGWSLEVEVQFYILAPLLGMVFALGNKTARRLVLVSAIVLGAWMGSSISFDNRLHFGLLFYGHYFLVGFLLADFHCLDWKQPAAFREGWDLAALAGWVVMMWCLIKGIAPNFVAPACLLAIYTAAFRGRFWRRIVTTPALYLIGGMCYTIYLYHSFFKSCFGHYTIRLVVTHSYTLNAIIQFLGLGAAMIVPCAVLFILFEKPFMRRDWPQRAWQALHRQGQPMQP